MTREQLGALILDSERQLYSTAKTILYSDQDCADAIQDTIVKAFSNPGDDTQQVVIGNAQDQGDQLLPERGWFES